jgi:1-acyl-sn-glycerol-3-phosphate acyltransferase
MAQKIFRILIHFIFFWIARIEIIGYDNLPLESGFILVTNHLGRLDSALLYYAIEREDLIMPVAEKYKTHWLFGPLVLALGGFFINRYDADLQAIREIFRRLKKGGIFVIAPEGTRSKVEALQEGRPGAAFFASKSGLPVIPVALAGTEDRVVLDNLKHFRRSHIIIHAGAPFTLPPLKGQDHDKVLAAGTEEIMCRIGAMLPERYRGFYADHPRLKELLVNA